MNFLNEIAGEYPSAISLAAGRPTDRFFDRLHPQALVDAFARYEAHACPHGNPAKSRAGLFQYGRTAGIINDLVAAQLRADEGVPASADRLLITSGCQEALALCLPALCPDPADVLLVCNPTYIGATGVASMSRIEVHGLPGADLCAEIEQAVERLGRRGKRARALYLIPEFDNPSGRVLDEPLRRALVASCARHRIVVLEDNPYGMFRYEGQPIPPMAALDDAGCVIYLSTYSKTLSPALRMGSANLPETLFGDRRASRDLFQNLVERKSFVTVNTGQIAQAFVGGILLQERMSLQRWVEPIAAWYRRNRDTMLDELQRVFADASATISWSRPAGGFFLSLDLPFRFDADAVAECANEHGVIVMPMSFFALDASQDRRIRLAFSAVEPAQIAAGIRALGSYVARRRVDETRSTRHGAPVDA